ncbi:hypothetical protein G9A89_010711 [Geosiphon pyriformis]|nr:hypothetical protein G9A89_010711 [Geosiphon pyriformis]
MDNSLTRHVYKVSEVVSLLANGIFKKKWFKSYDGVFTKELSRFHKLKVLVSRLAKAFYKVMSNRFVSLLKHWNSLDTDKTSIIQVLVSSDAAFNHICSAFFGVRKSYYASKLAEFLHAEELDIRSAIKKQMKSFAVDKGLMICSVLEHPF